MAKKCIFCSGSVAGGSYLFDDCEAWVCQRCERKHADTIGDLQGLLTDMVNAEGEAEAGEWAEKLESMLDRGLLTPEGACELQRFIRMQMNDLFVTLDREKKEERARAEKMESERTKASDMARAVMQEKERTRYLAARNARYEYTTDVVYDLEGEPNTAALQQSLTEHAREGWRLHTAFSNELGKNSLSFRNAIAGFAFSSGTNATVDATVLIYERCIQPDRWDMEDPDTPVKA